MNTEELGIEPSFQTCKFELSKEQIINILKGKIWTYPLTEEVGERYLTKPSIINTWRLDKHKLNFLPFEELVDLLHFVSRG